MRSDEASIQLMLRSALPIFDIDKIQIPGATIILCWVDVAERPDLADLAALHGLGAPGSLRMTWMAASPNEPAMVIGLRVEVSAKTEVVFHLAFEVKRWYPQLQVLSYYGAVWVVPGAPPPSLTGTRVMKMRDLASIPGILKGITLELEPYLQTVLRESLQSWQQHQAGGK